MSRGKGIEIPVTLDVQDAITTADTLGKKVSEALSRHSGGTDDPKLAKLLQGLRDVQNMYNAINESMQRMNGDSLEVINAKLYTSEERAKEATEALDNYKRHLESIGQSGLVKNLDKRYGDVEALDKSYFGKNRTAEITEYIQKLKELTIAKREADRILGGAKAEKWFATDPKWQQTMMQGSVGQEYAAALQRASDMAELLLLKLNQLTNENETFTRSAVKGGNSVRSNYYFVRTIFRDISKSIKDTISKIKSFVKHIGQAIKSMTHLNKSSKGLTDRLTTGFKHALRNIMRYVFGVRSLYFLFRRLRGYAKEALQEMAKSFPAVNQQMSRAVTALNQMKGAIGTAVQPMLNILVPALEKIAALVVKVANLIGSFFALFTGQSFIYKSVAVQTDYAASLEKTGKSADEAKKKLEGYLSPIDEINKYQSKQEDAADSGGGSGSGMGWEEVPIDPAVMEWYKKLKEMWKDGDFYNLGRTIGLKLKEWLESIPWKDIRETSEKLGKVTATLLNGFIEVKDLAFDIGTTIAQAINTVVEYVSGFVHNFNWKSFGKFIAEAFNGLFEGIDWDLIKDTVITGLKGLADSINSFVQTFHWDNISDFFSNAVNTLSNSIYTFFTEVDWETLGTEIGEQIRETIHKIDANKVGEAIGSVIHSAVTFLASILEQQNWSELRDKCKEMLEGLFSKLTEQDKDFIGDALKVVLLVVVGKAIAATAAELIAAKAGTAIFGAIFGTGAAASGTAAAGSAGTAAGTSFGSAFATALSAFLFTAGASGQVSNIYTEKRIKQLKQAIEVSEVTDPDNNLHRDYLQREIDRQEAWLKRYDGFFAGWKMAADYISEKLFGTETHFELVDDYGQVYEIVDRTGNIIWSNNKDLEAILQKYPELIKLYPELAQEVLGTSEAVEEALKTADTATEMTVEQMREYTARVKHEALDSGNRIVEITDAAGNKVITRVNEAGEEVDENGKKIIRSSTMTYEEFADACNNMSDDIITFTNTTDSTGNIVSINFKKISDDTKDMATTIETEDYNMETSTSGMVTNMNAEYGELVQGTKDTKDNVGGFLDDIKSFFDKDKWTLDSIKEGLSTTFNNAVNAVKGIWNTFADWLNDKLKIHIDTSSVIGKGLASVLGTSYLDLGKIPKLAQGAVIPPNKQFLAVMGDQKSGTNIETPLQTMVDAFNMALAQNGGSGRTEINFVLPDRRKIAQYVLEGGRIMQTSTGKNPFELA